ncbi:MAG: DUF998 domain-containing protein, partial [Promethearchaeota archaeon]
MGLDLKKYPIIILSGIAVIVFYCVFTFTSLALFPPPFSPLTNWLSDLGNSTYNPNGALFYNLGCILTGASLFPFFIGLYIWKFNELWNKILVYINQVIGCFAGFSLILIGVFSEDFIGPHIFWSNVFFETILFVLLITPIALFRHEKFIKWIAIYGIGVFIIDLIFVFSINEPILEWFTVFT